MRILTQAIASLLKVHVEDYCSLETAIDKYTLTNKDGSLTTWLKIEGSLQSPGAYRQSRIIEQLYDRLSGIMRKNGHRIQFMITRDPDLNERYLSAAFAPARQTGKRLDLDVDQILDERQSLLQNHIAVESTYVAVTTTLDIYTPVQRASALKKRGEQASAAGVGIKDGEYGQSVHVAVKSLMNTHRSFLTQLKGCINEFLITRTIPASEAIRTMAFEINPGAFNDQWKPSLPDSKAPVRLTTESLNDGDRSHLQHPSIAFQLFPQDPGISSEDPTVIKMGNRYNAPFGVDIPPMTPSPFDELFRSIPIDVPFRCLITIDTGHDRVLKKTQARRRNASALSRTSSVSAEIRDAARDIINRANQGHTISSASISFCTWGKDITKVTERKSVLMQACQSWGDLQLSEERGDAIEAWLGTIPAFCDKAFGNPTPWFLDELLTILPFSRPASPWSKGSMMFRTLDNKPFPCQPGSSKQPSSSDIVFAPPGFGKSVFLAAQNLSLILSAGMSQMPKIAILDIGYSSTAFVDLLKQMLPEHRHHLVKSMRMAMTRDNAINPFDTPLGCRTPLAVDKAFLSNFLSLVLTPAGSSNTIPRLPEIVGLLIESMYEKFSDDHQPNLYEPGYSKPVDEALSAHGIGTDENTSWWQVVDSLFEVADYHNAGIAQTFAVPLLSDATTTLTNDHRIKDVFGSSTYNNEPLLDFLNSMIVSVIKEYPILGSPTCFDTGSARIVALNLEDVAKRGGPQANKQTSVMYMLSRHVLCQSFYRDNESVREMPEKYQRYHARLIENDRATPRKICMDEFHRTRGFPAVQSQAEIDVREGRKYDVFVSILTHLPDDLPTELLQTVTNRWILSRGASESTTKTIESEFSPTPDSMKLLRSYVNGPTAEGSSFLYIGELKGSDRLEQVLRLTLGPQELWAYSTTPEDVSLRTALSEIVGLNVALSLLASRFPSGSAKPHIEKLKTNSDKGDSGGLSIVKELAIDLSRGQGVAA